MLSLLTCLLFACLSLSIFYIVLDFIEFDSHKSEYLITPSTYFQLILTAFIFVINIVIRYENFKTFFHDFL